MWQTVQELCHQGVLSRLDTELAAFLTRQDPQMEWPAVLGACLASQAVQEGNSCLDLAAVANTYLPREGDPVILTPDTASWRSSLQRCSAVGSPGEFQPLVLEGDQLFLQRYWEYESRITRELLRRAAEPDREVDLQALRHSLERHFPRAGTEGPDWPRIAAALAVLRPLALITGGPGTGKTSTLAGALAAIAEQPGSQKLEIRLAAPTGKAAARLQEAVQRAKSGLPENHALQAMVPDKAQTIHRLLGYSSRRESFRHHCGNPLPCHAVVVDEASMVDLALFAALLDALPPEAGLVLAGDPQQLAPVEAGTVLDQIASGEPAFSSSLAERLSRVTGSAAPPSSQPDPLRDCRADLRRKQRFRQHSGLGRLVEAVRQADADRALDILHDEASPELCLRRLPRDAAGRRELAGAIAEGFYELLHACRRGDPEGAFAAYRRYGVLDSLRQGPWGSEALNREIEQELRRAGHIPPLAFWYPGRPVLVTRNDSRLGLFNGDIGLTLQEGERLRIFFQGAEGGYRILSPNRLPPFETAYVLTVHKSQGSEFENVELLLPGRSSGLNCLQLVYTAVSRARKGLVLRSEEEVLRKAIATQQQRSCGIRAKLYREKGLPG